MQCLSGIRQGVVGPFDVIIKPNFHEGQGPVGHRSVLLKVIGEWAFSSECLMGLINY